MYTGRKHSRIPMIIGALLIVLLVFAIWFAAFRNSGSALTDEGTDAVTEAVQRAAQQCYAVEGVYPSDLSYLEEKYGLRVNEEKYYVDYYAYASNLPPSVNVIVRQD